MKLTRFLVLLAFIASVSITAAQVVPNRFIAVFKDEVSNPPAAAQALAILHNLQVGFVYEHALKGFAFNGAPPAAAALARRAEIAYVEPDQIFQAWEQTIPTGVDRADVDMVTGIIDGIDTELDVDIAIIDTGLDSDHPDLRIDPNGVRFFVQGLRIRSDGNWEDDNGHGTHVGGTAAAIDNGIGVVGVAPGARLTAVKVLDRNGSGYASGIIAGIDWVAARATRFEVANMSLGSSYYQPVNQAVAGAVEKGVVFVVAAGNESTDASTKSPASEPSAITVSALADSDGQPGGNGPDFYTSQGLYTEDDTFAPFSNYGAVVDICAPGVLINSTVPGGGYDATYSGTSMASPHVAGAAALYIAYHGLTKDAAGVKAVADALTSSGWKYGESGYLLGGDRDLYPEPLLNVARLMGALPIQPNNPPTITQDPLPVTDLEDVEVSFSATATDADGDVLTYSWNFGDGTTETGQSVTHTYLWGGGFTVTVTVTDGKGGSATASTTATITEINDIPIANAGGPYSGIVGTAVTFNGSATDYDNQDGTADNDQALTYAWDFGDESSGTGPSPSHTYTAAGTYTVTLTVSDGVVAPVTAQTEVTIAYSPSITLSAVGYKVKGQQKVDLSWGPITSASVVVYRNGVPITTTENDGAYTDSIGKAGNGTYTYQLSDGVSLSNEATVTFY